MPYKKNLTFLLDKVLSSQVNNPLIGYKNKNKWVWKTRSDLKMNILKCIDVLKDRNVTSFNRVMYKGSNSFEWISWNIATNSLGGIWVPLYDNQSDKYVNHIINDCKPRLFITDNKYNGVDCIDNSVLINNNFEKNYWEDLPINYSADIAKLIYTSGTTGNPKGVMLSHDNIISNYESINMRFEDFKDKKFTALNILPWAHIYGLTAELYYNILSGNKIAISSGKDNFINEIKEIQPDILYLVPRVLELIKSKLEKFDKPIIRYILPYIIKHIFGKNLVTIFIGGAMLDENTKQFYKDYHITLCEGYGCTETSPMVSVNHLNFPNRNEKSIGKIMDNLDVRINELNNEILVSGPSVMKGYWRNERATKSVFKTIDNKAFYKTGDEGYIKDNFLFYKGRISENYKLSNGKFVNLNHIENIVKKYVKNQFVIFGDSKPYNIIICEKSTKQDIVENLHLINKELEKYLQIEKIMEIEDDTFINYFTPKLSLKRKLFIKDFKDKIENYY